MTISNHRWISQIKLRSMTTPMILFTVILSILSYHVYALPPINFTDTVLTNRMIEALSDALASRDLQQLTPFQQLRQQLRQHPGYQQTSEQQQQQPSPPYYPSQIQEHQQQQPQQQQYPNPLSDHHPQYYPSSLPDNQHSFYQQQFIEQHQQQQQQQQQQQLQQQQLQQQQQQLHQQQQQQQQQQSAHPQNLPEQKFQHPIQPSHLPEQVQQAAGTDSRGYYYPYPYQNVNWYNFPYLWQGVFGGHLDATAPLAGVGAQITGLGTNGCPIGLCPNGATCAQEAGQWQCGCGLNGCPGIQNPCGLYGQYYFPYYPDASRFIQCDGTGVFWIRKCAPGTIFDPKISVCNYPPVVVETGRK